MTSKSRHPVFKLLLVSIIVALPFYYIFVITPLFSGFVLENLESNAQRPALHIAKMITGEIDNNLSSQALSLSFRENIDGYLQDFEIIKLKIFALDGTIIFSTNTEDIGEVYPNEVFWEKIRAGETYSSLIETGLPSVEDESFEQGVVESYYPIRNKEQLVVGAIELYTSVENQQKALGRLSLKLNLMVISILLLMGAVFIIAEDRDKKYLAEQLRFQGQILKAKEEWEKTFDAIEDVIAIIGLDLKIKRINKIGEKIFNASFKEILGRECYKVFGNSEEMCSDCPVAEVLEDGNTHHCEKKNPHLGKTFRISVSPLFDEFGKVNAIVHVAHDITHQRMMEQQMVSNQKMAALTVLTGGIAHNFRNILARILANSQLIENTYSNDQQLTEIAGWTVEAVHAGSKLVNGLIQFSQPLSKTEFQLIDLAQLIPDFHDFIRSGIPKNINMTYEVSRSIEVMGNYSTLFQVLTHISENAADAMPDGGNLSISAWVMDDMAHIRIADTGSGMDESILEKVFEPFFTTKEVDQGTGLGLSASYGIITEHGGDIKVESQKGSGTIFTIILPMIASDIEEDKIVPLEDIEVLGQKVLLVDDEEGALIPMTRLLEMIGYQVVGTKNCDEALAKFISWAPDLVILDYNMPGKNGIDCAIELNRLDPTIKAIIMSGSIIEELSREIEEKGLDFVTTCLAKPVSINELGEAVASSIGKDPGKERA